VDGVPPEGALTITLLSIGDGASEKVLVGTIIKSRSLLVISAVKRNDYYIFKLLFLSFKFVLYAKYEYGTWFGHYLMPVNLCIIVYILPNYVPMKV